MIYIVNKRRKYEGIRTEFPHAEILDLTSSSPFEYGKLLSPFFPHGNIPVPFSEGVFSASVEGIWQGLKVFERAGIDTTRFSNTTMKGLKRPAKFYGKPLGHQKGVFSNELLGYEDARRLIYLPSFLWVLENIPKVKAIIERIKRYSFENDLVFLDYNTNEDVANLKQPLSHAALIKLYILDKYPYVR